jgi:hypothetical protein
LKPYLTNSELESLVEPQDLTGFKVVSQDSYSDTEIWKTITSLKAVQPLLSCAIQTSVVGFGNKIFGEYEYKGEKVDVKKVYALYNVKSDLDSKIQPSDLTPRRIQRFFRKQISDYIKDNEKVLPYLWKKYSTLDKRYRHITFPGAESLIITDKDEAFYLIQTYEELDRRMETEITERIKRVFMAKGILSSDDF